MRPILSSNEPAIKVGPIDVRTFANLVEARRRHDHEAARGLMTDLRRLGWLIVPIAPSGPKRRGGAA